MPSQGWLRRVVDYLFGFDFFISYSHGDGAKYPVGLAERLERSGFKVFLDARGYTAGTELHSATRRRVRASKYLLVIARPAALVSSWVSKEVDVCISAKRVPIIVDVNNTFKDAPETLALKSLLKDRIYVEETVASLDGEPSDGTIERLRSSFRATRQDTIRLRAVAATAVFLAIVAAVAIWQYLVAEDRFQVALARQLSLQAQLLKIEDRNQLDLAVLLAAESMKRRPTVEADMVLRHEAYLLPRLVRRLDHADSVKAVAFRPGSTMVATASTKSGMQLFDFADGGRRRTIGPPGRLVHGMAFSGDGSRLSIAVGDAVETLSVESGAETARFTVEDFKKSSYARFSPDGRFLLTHGSDDHVRLWDVTAGRELPRPEGGLRATPFTAFSGDGNSYAAATIGKKTGEPGQAASQVELPAADDPTVKKIIAIWEAATGRRIHEVDVGDVDNPSLAIALSPDASHVLVSFLDGSVRAFSVDGPEKARMRHSSVIQEIAVSPDGRFVGTVDDETARIWTGADGREVLRRSSNDPFFPGRFTDGVVFSPDNRHFATVSLNLAKVRESPAGRSALSGTVWIWQLDVADRTGFSHGGRTRGRPFSPDGTHVAIANAFSDNELTVLELATRKPAAQFSGGARMAHVAFSSDGTYVAAANWDHKAYLYRMSGGRDPVALAHDQRVTAVSFSPDGASLATIGEDKTVRIWDTDTAKQRHRISFAGFDRWVALGPSGRFVATGGPADFIRILDAASGREIRAIAVETLVECLELSPDGKLLAAGDRSGRSRVWDVDSGRMMLDVTQTGSINALAFSPDSAFLAVGGADGTARVWEISSGTPMVRINNGNPTGAVAFVENGRLLAMNVDQPGPGAVIGGLVLKWPWQSRDVLADARRGLNRNMTEQEWRRYLPDEPYRKTYSDLPVGAAKRN